MRRAGSRVVLGGLLLAELMAGCGIVGPPIPPEDVGVAATIARQKKMSESQSREQKSKVEAPARGTESSLRPVGQDEELPALRPVGTR